MLSDRFNFFKMSGPIKKAGPLCFYQYQYNNIDIILIGEDHTDLPSEIASKYIDLFNKLLGENKQIRIFLEKTNRAKKNISDKDNGFIDCLCRLNNDNSKRIFFADSRDRDHGWDDFMSFLRHLANVVSKLSEQCKKKHKNIDDVPFFQNKDFVNSLYDAVNCIEKKITIFELCAFLESKTLEIDKLADQYSHKNRCLADFLGACVLGINDGLGMTLNLEKKYLSMGFTAEFTQHRSLGDICIDMMVKEGNFDPGGAWLNVLECYVTNFLDATIACNVWDEIQLGGEEKQTIIVATGAAHTSRLAKIMAEICQTVCAIPADPKGRIIMPEKMDEYLHGNFAHASTHYKCVMM